MKHLFFAVVFLFISTVNVFNLDAQTYKKLSVYVNREALVTVQKPLGHVIARANAPLQDYEFSGRTWIVVTVFSSDVGGRDRAMWQREFNVHDLEEAYNPIFTVNFCPALNHGPAEVRKSARFTGFTRPSFCCNCCYGYACTNRNRCNAGSSGYFYRPRIREIRPFKFEYRNQGGSIFIRKFPMRRIRR